jgi:hypothetical protein
MHCSAPEPVMPMTAASASATAAPSVTASACAAGTSSRPTTNTPLASCLPSASLAIVPRSAIGPIQ